MDGPQPPQTEYSLTAAFRQGPLPPPAELEKYEGLYPGATRLLFDNFINQSNHRMELEKTVIKGDNRRADIAQWLSFAIGITALVGGFLLILKGKDGFGFASIIGALGTLLSSFIGGILSRRKERENKDKIEKK
ncbi:MAG: DUF2335 domain-containing protein [Treponema sp.]|jgi:uncharacterized membrane protein|nr:DUF2335 domain-containing protein [Treponema sp.]